MLVSIRNIPMRHTEPQKLPVSTKDKGEKRKPKDCGKKQMKPTQGAGLMNFLKT